MHSVGGLAACIRLACPQELLTSLPCGHLFHDDCVTDWIQAENKPLAAMKCCVCKAPCNDGGHVDLTLGSGASSSDGPAPAAAADDPMTGDDDVVLLSESQLAQIRAQDEAAMSAAAAAAAEAAGQSAAAAAAEPAAAKKTKISAKSTPPAKKMRLADAEAEPEAATAGPAATEPEAAAAKGKAKGKAKSKAKAKAKATAGQPAENLPTENGDELEVAGEAGGGTATPVAAVQAAEPGPPAAAAAAAAAPGPSAAAAAAESAGDAAEAAAEADPVSSSAAAAAPESAVQIPDSLWSQRVLCDSCHRMADFRQSRLVAKSAMRWRCHLCGVTVTQLRRHFGAWPVPGWSLMDEVVGSGVLVISNVAQVSQCSLAAPPLISSRRHRRSC